MLAYVGRAHDGLSGDGMLAYVRQYSSASWSAKIANLQLGQKEVKTLDTQTFSKHVSNLQMGTDLDGLNITRLNVFMDKVAVLLDVFGAL
ncbi:unnamed protein product [Linum trigynum]|uniref:Uncharacterized protein n=1 Tax=Linum trigynum TaxID=586398 RepID=A0AAV2GRF4_9ROSI